MSYTEYLAATDSDEDPLTYSIVTSPPSACGTITNFNANTGEYTFTPAAGQYGTFTFTFTATDVSKSANAGTVHITIEQAMPPTVSLATSANGNVLAAQATITLTATASPGAGQTLSQVQFYQGSTSLGTVTNSPYTYTWSNVSAGTYALTAVATDTDSLATTSNTVSVTVINPVTAVSLSTSLASPQSADTPITLTASATGGTGVQYQFWVNGTLLRDYSASSTCTWTPTAAGSDTLTVYAQDESDTTVNTSLVYTINPSLTAVSLSATPDSPLSTTPITLTAAVTGGTDVLYQFSVDGTIVQSYSASATCVWTPTTAGSDTLSVTAQDENGVATATSVFPIVVKCVAPVFTPAPNTYYSAQSVTIATLTSAASIRYTTDGVTTPSASVGTVYSSPVSITADTLLQAIAYKSGDTSSSVTSGYYTIQCAAPVFTPSPNTYSAAQSVTIATTTSEASIRYTTDGITTPSSTIGTVYNSPVSITANTTLQAIAYENGASSTVTSGFYAIQCAAPVFIPAPATPPVCTGFVTITTSTSGATIMYTIGYTTPSASVGTVYSSPVQVNPENPPYGTIINAIAVASNMAPSPVTTGTYTSPAIPVNVYPPYVFGDDAYMNQYAPWITVSGSSLTQPDSDILIYPPSTGYIYYALPGDTLLFNYPGYMDDDYYYTFGFWGSAGVYTTDASTYYTDWTYNSNVGDLQLTVTISSPLNAESSTGPQVYAIYPAVNPTGYSMIVQGSTYDKWYLFSDILPTLTQPAFYALYEDTLTFLLDLGNTGFQVSSLTANGVICPITPPSAPSLPIVYNKNEPYLPLDRGYPSWQPNYPYNVGDYVQPTPGNLNGCYYECMQAGTSGSVEPPWWFWEGSTDGGTVMEAHIDNNVWKCHGPVIDVTANITDPIDVYTPLDGAGNPVYEATISVTDGGQQLTPTPGYLHKVYNVYPYDVITCSLNLPAGMVLYQWEDTTNEGTAYSTNPSLTVTASTPHTIKAIIEYPLTGLTFYAYPYSPQVLSDLTSSIQVDASAIGGSNVQYSYWLYNPQSSPAWSLLQDFSTSPCYMWTPTAVGNYLISVTAKDGLTGKEVNSACWYTITGTPLTAVSLTETPTSPQSVSTPITLTASATGGTNVQYGYWAYNPAATPAWSELLANSPNSTYTWTPTVAGSYLISATAIDGLTGLSVNTSSWYTINNASASTLTLTPDLLSPQPEYTSITLSAYDAGNPNATYDFSVYNAEGNSAWTGITNSTNSTCVWTPTAEGNYQLMATEDGTSVSTTMWYTIGMPLESVALSTEYDSPWESNCPITLSSTATGGYNLQYDFSVYDASAATPVWTQLQGYSTSSNYTWTPTTPGNYLLSTSACDEDTGVIVNMMEWYAISGPLLTAVSLTESSPSPQSVGTPIKLTAAATGGINVQYDFSVYSDAATWVELQDSVSPTYTWTPNAAGWYLLSVTAIDGITGTESNTTAWYNVQ